MADVNINKFRASVVRDGSKPSSPGFIVSEGQDPVNPPGTNNYVPYSGATANVELGEYGVEAGFITLDTTPTNTPTDQGTIFWDADDETVDIVLNGYTMKIGEDLFYPVKNQTGSTIAKGVAVRFNGTVGASGRLLIAPFIADGSVPSSRFMGVTAEEILNGEDGKVLYFGRVRGINTNAFNEGDILYASTTVAGGYQTAIPVAPNNIVQVAAVVTKSATVGTIFVRPTLGSNINKDEGVKIVSVADKNLLQYQSGTSLWENKSLSQVLGGTSAQFVKGDGSLDSTTYGTGTVTSVGLSSATSGVTIGSSPVTTSGTITLAIATASGSQNGLLSSTDWTTFNNKQNALTNPVTGTGSAGQIAYFTGTSAITSESGLTWDATNNNLSIGGATANSNLTVSGSDNTDIFTVLSGANSRLHVGTVTSPSVSTYIRSQNNYALNLGTNSTNYLTILSSGNVGISTNNPSQKFTIVGSNTLQSLSVGNDTTHQILIGADSSYSEIQGITQGVGFNKNLILQRQGANVLIGTSADNGARLQVSGSTTTMATIASSGTASGLQLTNTGPTASSWIIQSDGGSVAGQAALRFYSLTASAYRMSIDGSGNVLIGTTNSVDARLNIQRPNDSGTLIRMGNADSNYFDFARSQTTGALSIQGNQTGFNNIILAPTSGNVGIGETNPTSSAGWTPRLVLNATSAALVVKGINGQENSFGTSNGLYIDCLGNSTGTNNNIIFRTSNSNSSFSASERMRITSGGYIKARANGGTYFGGSYNEIINNNNVSGAICLVIGNSGGTNTNNTSSYHLIVADNGGDRLYIYGNGNVVNINNSYGTLSDIALKENIKDATPKLEDILKLKVRNFNLIGSEEKQIGFIAQELEEIFPKLIDVNGIDKMKSIKTTVLIPILVKAIQELKQEIDTLKN
jgi:hypothetical protein